MSLFGVSWTSPGVYLKRGWSDKKKEDIASEDVEYFRVVLEVSLKKTSDLYDESLKNDGLKKFKAMIGATMFMYGCKIPLNKMSDLYDEGPEKFEAIWNVSVKALIQEFGVALKQVSDLYDCNPKELKRIMRDVILTNIKDKGHIKGIQKEIKATLKKYKDSATLIQNKWREKVKNQKATHPIDEALMNCISGENADLFMRAVANGTIFEVEGQADLSAANIYDAIKIELFGKKETTTESGEIIPAISPTYLAQEITTRCKMELRKFDKKLEEYKAKHPGPGGGFSIFEYIKTEAVGKLLYELREVHMDLPGAAIASVGGFKDTEALRECDSVYQEQSVGLDNIERMRTVILEDPSAFSDCKATILRAREERRAEVRSL